MKIVVFFVFVFGGGIGVGVRVGAQPVLKTGDVFPDLVIRPIINAPVKALDVHGESQSKFLILNFWGTWCSPCLPEMDSLAKLQLHNNARIQVVGISNEPVARLQKYLERKPSSLWLASDTLENLYQQFSLAYVGQSAIISPGGRIVAMVRTDSIDQTMIDRLLRGQPIRSSAETGKQIDVEADLFAVDSAMDWQVTWSGYRAGVHSMSKSYLKSIYTGRRRSWVNVSPVNIYRDLYHVSYKQVVYEVPEKTVSDWEDKRQLYCLDLLVRPTQKDSFMILLKQAMDRLCPVKGRLEKKMMPVYVLSRLDGSAEWVESKVAESSYSFSGKGFEGTGIVMEVFRDYVANELQLPVVDESGLKGRYDIRTENVLRTEADMLAALKKLGLTVVKTQREMDVVVIYR